MKPLLALLLVLPLMQDPPPETPKPAEVEDADLVALAARCGRDVQWRKANDLEGAVDEARKSGRLVFAYVYDRSRSSMFGNRFKDQFMMAGPFADPDLVAYLNRKFVPARFNMNSAFAEEVGTRLNDVIIPAVLFLDPDKKVLHKYDRITSASTELLFATCRSVLEKNSAFDKPGEDLVARDEKVKKNPDDLRARYLLGLELLREAQWDRALAAFSEVVKRAPASREAVESLYRTAGIHRLLRRPAEAAAAVDAALKANAGVGAKIEGDLFLEKARVLLGQGKLDDARKILEGIVKDHPKGTRTPEAAYFLGAVLWSADLEDEAKKAWSVLAKDLEVNPWAKKAAAEALERGPFVNGWEYLEWIDPAALADEPKGTERPRKPEEYPQVVDAALEYMLKEQRKDGSWRNVKGQFEFRNCITVIGHMALSAWGDRPAGRSAAARAKARKFIDEWSDKRTDAEGMAIWDHVFALILYARLAPDAADEAAKKDIKKRMKREIRALAAVQRPKGTWSYVGMGPSSFTTGGVMFALWEAKQAGATVDDAMIERAFEGMKAMKSKEETYYYSDQSSDEFDDGHLKGSVGRMAVCYLAEHLWGKCDLAKLTWAMDKFIEFRIHLKRVRKSTDWHAGAYANASYFFFYDYWFASMAMPKLAEPARARYLTALRNDLLETNEVDGTWVDTHLFGKPYGTAMALMILKNVGGP